MLILAFGLPRSNAVAISLMAMVGTTFSASIAYIRQGRVDYKVGLLYDVLDVPNVVVGAYLTTILPRNFLAGLCGFLVVFISLLLIKTRKFTVFSTRKSEQSTGKERKRRKIDPTNQMFEYTIWKTGLILLSSFTGGLVTGLAGLGGGITDTTTMILLGVPARI